MNRRFVLVKISLFISGCALGFYFKKKYVLRISLHHPNVDSLPALYEYAGHWLNWKQISNNQKKLQRSGGLLDVKIKNYGKVTQWSLVFSDKSSFERWFSENQKMKHPVIQGLGQYTYFTGHAHWTYTARGGEEWI